MSDSPVSPEDIRAAAETYRELGPEYRDAVVASFVDKIGREVDARVEARLAAAAPPAVPPARRKRRRVLRDVTVAAAGAVAAVGLVAVAAGHHGGPVIRRSEQVRVLPNGQVIVGGVIVGPNGRPARIPQPRLPQAPARPKAPRAPAAPPG
jgi:hypothetical protein